METENTVKNDIQGESEKVIAGTLSSVIMIIVIIIITIIIICISLVSFVFVGKPWFIEQFTLPEIAKNLPKDTNGGTEIFNKRVKDEYPIGTSVDVLVTELEEFGFVSEKEEFLEPNEGFYSFARICGVLCVYVWDIKWKKSDDDKLIEIEASFRDGKW